MFLSWCIFGCSLLSRYLELYILDLKYIHYNFKVFFVADALGLLLLKRTLKKKFCNKQEKNFFHFAGLVLSDWGVRGTLTMWAACHVNEIEWGLVVEYISFVTPQKISWHIKSVTPVMYVFRRYDYETFLQACIQSWLFRWLVFKSAEIPSFFTDSTSEYRSV